jgi:hypothetical protein
MATSAAEKPVAATSERRMAPRHPAEAMPSITGVRLSPGGREAWLVNISCTGVLLRCATKLPPGTPVQVTLEGTFQPGSIKGRVARCFVADIGRPVGLSYHIGIHFNETITIDGQPAETPEPAPELEPTAAPAAVLVNRW